MEEAAVHTHTYQVVPRPIARARIPPTRIVHEVLDGLVARIE